MRETWLSENQRLVSQVRLMLWAHPGWWGRDVRKTVLVRFLQGGKMIKHGICHAGNSGSGGPRLAWEKRQ